VYPNEAENGMKEISLKEGVNNVGPDPTTFLAISLPFLRFSGHKKVTANKKKRDSFLKRKDKELTNMHINSEKNSNP